jgi:hypothetical protein
MMTSAGAAGLDHGVVISFSISSMAWVLFR